MTVSETAVEPPVQQLVWDRLKSLPVSGQDLLLVSDQNTDIGWEETVGQAVGKSLTLTI